MEPFKEAEATNQSVRFAGDYVEKKFKNGRDTEKSLVLNSAAHGFFMGLRHCEARYNRPFWKVWVKKGHLNECQLGRESVKASNYYIRKKHFKKLDLGTGSLIKAVVGLGFQEGFRYRERWGKILVKELEKCSP